MMRAAGAKAQLMAKEGDYATLRMPSGEVRKVRLDCEATIGVVGNLQHQNMPRLVAQDANAARVFAQVFVVLP
jgi:ribosomal protein L2